MKSQTGQKIVTINILPNISKSKGNQTIKLGQSIEFKKAHTKCRRETSPRPFHK